MSRFNFPSIPSSKLFNGKYTEEQIILLKLYSNQKLTDDEENSLLNICKFYEKALLYLKQISLEKN